ncbi:HAD family hydrolase [Spongiactinospora rosea]|uniref:HAD family hydrolase n=1 Tax=Spongiactinospora rosea TaxID=2248750 RepID=UPI001CED9562|nr:HAD family hydrolase [Spongiactinospora rosea]
MASEYRAKEAAGRGEVLGEGDLYPDVRPVLAALRRAGHRVLIAGNQSVRAGELLRDLNLPADAIATSGEWGIAKPDAGFFARVVDMAEVPPENIVYVGDHPANDILPAKAAGMWTVHIRRGPLGLLWGDSPSGREADWQISSLAELAEIEHLPKK